MKEAKVLKYQFCYPWLNKRLFTEKPQVYKAALIYIRLDELQEKGAKMLKAEKPNSGGTLITFVPVESVENFRLELEKVVSDGKAIGMEFKRHEN